MSAPPCDPEIFRRGTPVLVVDTGDVGGSRLLEQWVVMIRTRFGVSVDWHYSGGRAQVLSLEPDALRRAINEVSLPLDIDGEPMRAHFVADGFGLPRLGVNL